MPSECAAVLPYLYLLPHRKGAGRAARWLVPARPASRGHQGGNAGPGGQWSGARAHWSDFRRHSIEELDHARLERVLGAHNAQTLILYQLLQHL